MSLPNDVNLEDYLNADDFSICYELTKKDIIQSIKDGKDEVTNESSEDEEAVMRDDVHNITSSEALLSLQVHLLHHKIMYQTSSLQTLTNYKIIYFLLKQQTFNRKLLIIIKFFFAIDIFELFIIYIFVFKLYVITFFFIQISVLTKKISFT